MTWNAPLSEEEYEVIISHFKKNRPEIASDPEKIRAEIVKLDAEIAKFQEVDDDNHRQAISIILQVRNPLARMIGDPEVPWSALQGEETPETEPDEIESKHVAVFVTAGGGALLAAFKQSLGLFKDQIRFQCYGKMSDLLYNLLSGGLCGIVGIQMERQASIEGYVRHDLKNRSGWDYDRANKFVLPPCQDFFLPHQLIEIVETLRQMQSSEFATVEGEEFDLEKALPALVAQMRILSPDCAFRIVVIDDTLSEVEGILQILGPWLNLDSFYINPEDGLDVGIVSRECEVVLLDEAMGKELTGTQVRDELIRHGFKGVITSITGGEKPDWASEHFQGKISILKSREAAEEFVRFMNKLIRQFDR